MLRHRVEEFGPFRRAAGIGHVAADEHEIERMCGMNGREARHDAIEAIVAARAAAPAFDAKAISLADDMKVRKMRDAPGAATGRRGIECSEIERLVHAGIRKAPDQRGDREIDRHQHDGVGERRHDQAMQHREIGHGAHPARAWPDKNGDQCRASAHEDAAQRPSSPRAAARARRRSSARANMRSARWRSASRQNA